MGDHAVDGEPPINESSSLKALEVVVERRLLVGKRSFRNLAAKELTGQRVPRQQPLGRIGERCAGAVDPTTVGRDQS